MTDVYFEGLHESGVLTPPNRARQHNLELVARGSRFNSEMNLILAKDPDTKKFIKSNADILAALEKAYTDFSTAPHGLTSQELMRFFNAFMDIKAHDHMIALYNNCKNQNFQNSPIVHERIAVALNMLKQPTSTIAWVQQAFENQSLVDAGLSNAEMYSALGKAYSIQELACEAFLKEQNDTTRAGYKKAFGFSPKTSMPSLEEVQNQARQALILSKNAYEKGFLDGYAYYPGINVVYSDLALGNIDKARKNAELVYHATLRDGGLESADYWTVVTMVESLCILGKGHEQELKAALNRVAQISHEFPDWRFESTFSKWDTVLKPALEKLSDDTAHQKTTGQIKQRCGEVEKYLKEAHTGINFKAAAAEITQTAGEQLLAKSHGYRGMSIFDAEMITNNFSFGGLISHVMISRRDKHEFKKLLALPLNRLAELIPLDSRSLPETVDTNKSLFQINDPKEFIIVTQRIIRQNFGTDTKRMEIIDDHLRNGAFDKPTRALDTISGAPESASERTKLPFEFKTSVVAEFVKGLGDCRHHAQALQIMFDVWQEHKLSAYLKTAYDALSQDVRESSLSDFRELERTRLRTIDVQVHAPIRVIEPYRPERPVGNPEGFVYEHDRKFVESHTMNMLFELGKQNQINEATLCCAFYQKVYPWAFLPIEASSIVTSVSGDKPNFEFQAGQLSNVEGATDKKVNVNVHSEGFSGNRTRNIPDDPGLVYENGHPCPQDFDILTELQRRNEVTKQLAEILRFVEAKNLNTPKNAAVLVS